MSFNNRLFEINRTTSEYMRGIAITLVVLGHILGGVFEIIDTHITSMLGIGGVSIFLLMSGYGLYQSYRRNGLQFIPFWNKKIEKVFLPYTIITVIYYLYMMACGKAPGYPALLANILCVDYSRTMDGTMWYMSFLLLWYLSFFLVFYFSGPMMVKVGMLLLLGCAFHDYWLRDIFGQCAWQFATNAFTFPCGVVLGYLLDTLNHFNISEKWRMQILCFVQVCLIGGAILILATQQILHTAYWKCGVALFVLLYALLSLLKNECKILKWLGANAFLIYLVEGKLITIWSKFKLVEDNILLYLISYTAAIIGIVYLFRYGCVFIGQVNAFFERKQAN